MGGVGASKIYPPPYLLVTVFGNPTSKTIGCTEIKGFEADAISVAIGTKREHAGETI